MPSSSFVEVDIHHNDTDILENPDVVIASEPPSPPKAKVSRSQEEVEETVVSPTPKKMKTSTKSNGDANQPAKETTATVASSVVTPRAKPTKNSTATAAVALTPSKGAVATPGESAKKEKKNVRTLDTFFGKGKKKDVATKPLLKIGAKPAEKGAGKKGLNKEKKVGGEPKKKIADKKCGDKPNSSNVESTESVSEKAGESKELEKELEDKATPPIRTKKGKPTVSVLESVEDGKEVQAKNDEESTAKQEVVNVDLVDAHSGSKDLEMKDAVQTEIDDDDDKTVELEEDKIPPPAYDSSSEASDVEMEDVVTSGEEVSPIKTDESASSPQSCRSDKPSKAAAVTSIADSLSMDAASPSQPSKTANKSNATAADTKAEAVKSVAKPKPSKSSTKKETSKPKADKSVSKSAAAKTESVPLSDENQARMKSYTALRERYVTRADEVASRSTSDDFAEESLGDEELSSIEKGSVNVGENADFPDELLPRLLILVQGSALPLSILAKNAMESLSEFVSETRGLSIESISSKIKLLAQRKPYLNGKPPSASEKPTVLTKLDCFEDANACYLWRWELSSIDLLPQKEASKVKKARTMRKKLQSHHTAIFKLIASIDSATKWLQKNPNDSSPSPSIPVLAKVSDMEEKVLKYEREEEKARLLKEAKAQKSKGKVEDQAAKQAAKQKEKEEAKKRKEEEKAAAAKEREEAKLEAKRKKDEEKLKLQQEAEEKDAKRKAKMLSFFSVGNSKKKQKTSQTAAVDKVAAPSFDSDRFRLLIDSKDDHNTTPFVKRKQQKTKDVKVSVHITVLSDNPFAPQPYDEEKVISVKNKYKFLGFHEDHRPPYHGTWSKSSSLVTGRRPFGKDPEYLNYDVDSEAEWEQEDEEGEDCDKSDGDEEDMPDDDDNDSFLAAEDELGLDEEDDEDTKNLRKKKLLSDATISAKACVVAPMAGGICHEMTEEAIGCVVEGFDPRDAMDLLASHIGRVLAPELEVCMDALPPKPREEQEPKAPATQKMTPEGMKLMAQFVHNSTINSKEKIVTELLNAHPNIATSRAQAMRELEVTAEKRRLPKGGGVVWEVKADHLSSLGLTEKDLKSPPTLAEEAAPVAKEVCVEKAAAAKKAPKEKLATKAAKLPAATSTTASPKPAQTKQSKKRPNPAVPTASANLFAAFMAKAKKQKTE